MYHYLKKAHLPDADHDTGFPEGVGGEDRQVGCWVQDGAPCPQVRELFETYWPSPAIFIGNPLDNFIVATHRKKKKDHYSSIFN